MQEAARAPRQLPATAGPRAASAWEERSHRQVNAHCGHSRRLPLFFRSFHTHPDAAGRRSATNRRSIFCRRLTSCMPSKVAPGDDIPGEAFTPQAYKTPFSAERARGIAPQQFQLADGRQLEYFTDGDPSKPAVFLIHGQWGRGNVWIGPPRTDIYVICPTRPNYGGSTPHPGNNYSTFADDGAPRHHQRVYSTHSSLSLMCARSPAAGRSPQDRKVSRAWRQRWWTVCARNQGLFERTGRPVRPHHVDHREVQQGLGRAHVLCTRLVLRMLPAVLHGQMHRSYDRRPDGSR